jgi:acetyl esterase/lipase
MATSEGLAHERADTIHGRSLFDAFDVETVTFKYAQGKPILLDVLVPQTLSSGKHPVNIHFHGGFLVNGARNMVNITPPRILQHAIDEHIIIVTPDYRLLPESNGREIFDDIEDVWDWVSTELYEVIRRMRDGKAEADIGKIMVSGESAGT